jgi:hypothetical protein
MRSVKVWTNWQEFVAIFPKLLMTSVSANIRASVQERKGGE